MGIKGIRGAGVLAGFAAAAAFTGADVAQALDWKFGGQVNRMVRYADNGDKSDFQHVDNSASQTRLRVKGMEGYGTDRGWGFKWETGITSNLSEFQDIEQSGNDSQAEFLTRQAKLFYWGPWGKLSWGQQNGAGRGAGRRDLSGTNDAQNNDTRRVSAVRFRDSTGFSSNDVGWVFRGVEYEGERDDMLRYDSPTFANFKASLSWGNDDEQEYAIKYRAVSRAISGRDRDPLDVISSFFGGGTQADVAVAYIRNGDSSTIGDSDYRIVTSGSVLWTNGINVTLAWGQQEPDDPNASNNHAWYSKLGYRVGPNRFSVDYGQSAGVDDQDFAGSNLEGTRWGAGYERDFDPYLLYAGYEQYGFDRKATGQPDPDDVRSFVIGGRLNF